MDPEPFCMEDFLASLTEVLKISGDARAVAVVVEGDCRFNYCESDFGIDYWSLYIALPIHLFCALTEDEREEVARMICDAGQSLFLTTPQDQLRFVSITPKVTTANEGWREEAVRFLRGEGVTNQGRVRSDNIASKQHQGLLFRSQAEITLYEALTRAKLAVAPLPVFVRIGKSYNRIEPDFLVVFKGLTFIVEVDGDTFHRELPAEADKRLVPLTYEGLEVRRIRAADVATDELADAAVRDLQQFMSRRKESR